MSGSVFDSLSARGLAGATVRMVMAEQPAIGVTAESDSSGAFSFRGVRSGSWLATFFHPRLDSLALDPPVVQVEVVPGAVASVRLATPSPRTLLRALCDRPAPDVGVVIGVVRAAASGEPLAGATVELEWPEWVIGRRSVATELLRRSATTDVAGRFTACDVPNDVQLRAVAHRGNDSSGVIAVHMPRHGFVYHDMVLADGASITYLPAAVDTNGAAVAPRRGGAGVRGTVWDATGAPVAGASVRVIGSGDVVRSTEAGQFEVGNAVAGSQTLEVRALGYTPSRRTVVLRDGELPDVAVSLGRRALAILDTVRVHGTNWAAALQGFERRSGRRSGGYFLTGTDLRAQAPLRVSDALRSLNGVRVVDVAGYGQRILMRGMAGRACQPLLYVDGVRLFTLLDPAGGAEMFLDDFVSRDEVAAMEVYPRSSGVPPEYADANGCGTVLVWSRRYFGGREPDASLRR